MKNILPILFRREHKIQHHILSGILIVLTGVHIFLGVHTFTYANTQGVNAQTNIQPSQNNAQKIQAYLQSIKKLPQFSSQTRTSSSLASSSSPSLSSPPSPSVSAPSLGQKNFIPLKSEFHISAETLAEKKIISKKSSEKDYRLQDNITRAELAKIVANTLGYTPTSCDATKVPRIFSDSQNAGNLCGYIEVLARYNIVSRLFKTFRPNDSVTRAEMIKMLVRAKQMQIQIQGILENPSSTDSTFPYSDISNNNEFLPYIREAQILGCLSRNTLFRPNDSASRGEAFKITSCITKTSPSSVSAFSLNPQKNNTGTGNTGTGSSLSSTPLPTSSSTGFTFGGGGGYYSGGGGSSGGGVSPPSPINGFCGGAHTTTSSGAPSTIPTTNLCTSGNPTSISTNSNPLILTGAYTWSCTGTNGGSTASCSANKSDTSSTVSTGSGSTGSVSPAPTVNLSISNTSVLSGQTVTLTWSSTNATSCTKAWGIPASTATGGSYTTGPLTTLGITTYSIGCTGSGGTSLLSTSVTVSAHPLPTVALMASPNSVSYSGTSLITWSSTNATSCTKAWGIPASTATGGSYTTGPLTNPPSSTYSINCIGIGGSVNRSVTIATGAPPSSATALTLSGPSFGLINTASTNFTIGTNGTLSGTVTVTPSAIGGGTFSPMTVNLTSATPTAIFTYTPTSTGSKTLSLTNNRGLGNPSSMVYTANALGTPFASFTLTSPTTQLNAPFTIGHAFRKGDIPSGFNIVLNGADAQATIKNRWPDGSAKIAIIAGTTLLTANTPTIIELSAGTASTGTILTTNDLKNTGITASISAGGFGSASWTTTDWDAPFQTWISGHKMSSWTYRKQVGSDAHLVAWMEVRLYDTGEVEVLPWVENGYLKVAGGTNKSATYTFTLGGTSRFSQAVNLLGRQRTPLVSGTALSYWLVTDPIVTPRHDVAYLQDTRLVPKYMSAISPSAGIVTSLPSTYTPLQQGSMPPGMGTAGYHPSIGLLPEWDVLYLTSTAPTIWAAIQRNAYSAGRYGFYVRDENTNRPARFSDHPTLVIDGSSGIVGVGASSNGNYVSAVTGGGAPTYNSTHSPAMGYMAYLLTGRHYHMETTQFQSVLHFLKNTDTNRRGSQGILFTQVGSNTVRGAAWSFRTLAQAVNLGLNDDPVAIELQNSLELNIDEYYDQYVANANNPLGFVQPYSDYSGVGDNKYFEAAWQQDFFTAAFGMMKSFDLNLDTTTKNNLTNFFTWKAQSIIGRLGGTSATDYLYRDAAPYTITVAPSDSPDYTTGTGPWYNNWGEVYEDTNNMPNPGTPGDLRGGNFPGAASYWGNLMPAIAYAVEHGVSGANAAYLRMIEAGNWSLLEDDFDAYPVWGVVPPVIPSSSPATALILSGPSSGTVSNTSTNFTVGVNGTLSGTVTVTPSVVGGGTFSPMTVNLTSGSPTATFTYTPNSIGSKTISITNNGGLTNPTNHTYAVSALSVTLSGPNSGVIDVTSTNFTVGANGIISGTVTVTPSVVGGGTFSPMTVNLTSGSPTATFTYTPNSIGSKTISITNNGGLTNPTNHTYAVSEVSTGLDAAYSFSEGIGSTTADISGNSNIGTLTNGPTWITGKNGNGVNFDGTNDLVALGNLDIAGSALTLSAWIKADTLTTTDARIISKTTGTAEADHYFMLSTTDSGGIKLRARLKTSGTTTTLIATSGIITPGAWTHVALVYNGSTMKLYQDGVEVGSTAKAGILSTNPSVPVAIGANPQGTAVFDGVIDDVRIYSRALTLGEIQTDMVTAVGDTPPAATILTLSGPSSGLINTPSTNFTVGTNGTLSGTVTVTPSAIGGGTFSPMTVNLTSGSPTATFTYTPASAGSKTINLSNNRGLSNPSTVLYEANINTSIPSWVSDLPLWQWYEIPDTALSSVEPVIRPLGINGPVSKITTWNGAALRRSGSVYMLGAAGGHADYAGNEVNTLVLNTENPTWVELKAPTSNADIIDSAQFYLDLRPASTHTYYNTQYIDQLDRMLVFASPGLGGPGLFPNPPVDWSYMGNSRSFSFNYTLGDWDSPDYIAPYTGGGDFTAGLAVKHPITGDVYLARNGSSWWRWNHSNNTWTNLGGFGESNYAGAAIDSLRDRMLIVGDYSGNLNPRVRDLSGNSIAVNFTGLGPDVLKMGGYPGVVYDETNDVFLVFKNTASGILTYRVDANTFVVDEPNISGTLPATRQNGIQNSIQYVPELGGVVIANSYYGNVKFMRTAVIGPVATAFTLSGPTSGTTNSPATFTVTPMGGPLSAGAIVNISASGAIVSTSTLTFEAGTTTPQTFTITRVTDGTTTVSVSNSLGLINTGGPISFTSGDSYLGSVATSMIAGQWAQITVNGLNTSLFIDGANNTLGYMDKGNYDPINKQVRFIGQAHGGDQRYHQYDEATNTFSNLTDPSWDGVIGYPGYIGHGYQHNTIDPATGDQYYARFNSTTIHRLTRSTGVWSTIVKPATGDITGAIEWLPEIGTQGGLIAYFGTSLYRWDKALNSWSTPENGTLTGQNYHTVAVGSAPHDVVIFGGGNAGRKLWKVGPTGGALAITDSPISVGIGSAVTTTDPVSGDIIVINGDSAARKYDVDTDTWSTLTMPGTPSFGSSVSAGSHIIAVPMPAYGVIMFVFGNSNQAWLYKHSN